MPDLIDACHYGVARDKCRVGCGLWCRPARREMNARLAKRHEEEAPLYARLAGHDACGTDDCCHTCSTATPKEIT